VPIKTGLDGIDRKILAVLAGDARTSHQAVAQAVGLSRPAVVERIRRLEQTGFIRGYAVKLDRGRAGYPVTAFVAVRYGGAGQAGDEPGMRRLEDHPGVLECHHVAGDDCYVLKVVAPDLEGLQTILRDIAATQPQQLITRTTIVLGTLFEKPALVLPAPPAVSAAD
jgi:Lrp/AsnC family leucine-responsive transcriptional regulator